MRRVMMIGTASLLLMLAHSGVSAQTATGGERATYPIAGTQPDRRPAAAPMISKYAKDQTWYAGALSGVAAPYPGSLRFLEYQGAWSNPFIRPGMTGPYDLRGWHRAN